MLLWPQRSNPSVPDKKQPPPSILTLRESREEAPPAYRGESRLFAWAVLASIAFHGLLLLALPGLRDLSARTVIDSRRIEVRLREPRPPAVQETTPSVPARRSDAERAAVARRKPAASPIAKPASSTLSASIERTAPTPEPISRSEPQPTVPAPPARAPATDPDRELLALFRADIVSAAKRYKRYPRLALENNWEGKAEVRITFSTEGRRVSIAIAKSSGHESLDRQAIDTIAKALVPVPPALRGREFAIDVPVIYNMKD
jgi:protein TonB